MKVGLIQRDGRSLYNFMKDFQKNPIETHKTSCLLKIINYLCTVF